MKLYHCLNARSFRPLWMLEEMGLPYELVMLPFPPRERASGYLEINPLGTIPFFVDGETAMTESAAICEYLALRYGPSPLAVRSEEAEFGRYLNGLHLGEATLTFPQTLVFRYTQLEPEERRLPQVVEDYGRWFVARLRAIEPALAEREWFCAGRFTAADISVGFALMFAERLGFWERFKPATAAYWARLKARDGFQRAVAAQKRAAAAQGMAQPAPI